MSLLTDIRVVELAGIGPVPHAAMILADLGADVILLQRPTGQADGSTAHTLRGRTVVNADLKDPEQLAQVRRLIDGADVLLEGFRPGVAERLGIGPEDCRAGNPGLVYARATGWGQTGPFATMAGHDLNYLAVTGLLHATGPADSPIPPLNLVGDFGGGSTTLVVGILASLLSRTRTGTGHVVDGAMAEGALQLGQLVLEMRTLGQWSDRRADNILDGGAPFYRCYRCADGGFVAVASIEEPFYALLLAGLELDPATLPHRWDRSRWPELADILGARLATRTRDQWAAVFDGTDACVTPVLTFDEASDHPQLRHRQSLIATRRGPAAAPAPRFTPAAAPAPPTRTASLGDVIDRWGNRSTGVLQSRG